MIDLQIQTTASDGKFSPRECVKMAKENGVTAMAITDHDTVGGIEEGLHAGKEFGVEVIPGIELSCTYEGKMIHILGYGIDYQNPALLGYEAKTKHFREHRGELIVNQLKAMGFVIDYEKVKARAAGVVTRPHIALEILENPANTGKLKSEGIQTKQDFFDRYIGEGGKVEIPDEELTPDAAVHLIHGAGGVAVWSHPAWPSTNKNYPWIEETLQKFIAMGVDGMETFSYMPEDDAEFLNTLAGKYNIPRTAGSDFHDVYPCPDLIPGGITKIGGYPRYGFSTDGIYEWLVAAIKKRKPMVV